MARPFVLEIAESIEFLERSLKRAKSGARKERLQMLWWIKTGQIRYRQEISRRLSRSPATPTRWLA
ncbi:MAG: IS630 family transposase, partial [Calothrix sp. SM1_7_51]|nr:IS630 family transposase [Calothrix sp. SM1_7_51]